MMTFFVSETIVRSARTFFLSSWKEIELSDEDDDRGRVLFCLKPQYNCLSCIHICIFFVVIVHF